MEIKMTDERDQTKIERCKQCGYVKAVTMTNCIINYSCSLCGLPCEWIATCERDTRLHDKPNAHQLFIRSGKDKLMAEYIDQLIDGFEDKRFGMSALLRMVIKVGCDYNKAACHEECKDCPLTSYLCRQMHTQSKLLLEDDDEE